MDLLKKEMERKKRALAQAKSSSVVVAVGGGDSGAAATTTTTTSRYLNAGQLRRLQEEEEERLNKSASTKRQRTTSSEAQQGQVHLSSSPADDATKKKDDTSSTNNDRSAAKFDHDHPSNRNKLSEAVTASRHKQDTEQSTTLTNIPVNVAVPALPDDISSRLRSLGLPIRLFGEVGDAKRLQRLDQATVIQQSTLKSLSEKQEFRLGAGHGIRNPFLDQNKKKGTTMTISAESSSHPPTESKADKDDDEDDEGGDDDDPHKRIYRYLKSLLQQWEQDLARRPEAEQQSVAGKKDTNTFHQCKDYIAPLFKLLKKRQLDDSVTTHLTKIVDHCLQGEFVRANDAYMDVAVGRAPWPLGVTAVGIHARTGRSKIESSKVAHIMNSELQRKYLTSVKRLITFAQTKSTVDPSKKVLN